LAPSPTAMIYVHNDLKIHAELGNMSMVHYLLNLVVPVQESWGEFETPLVLACRGWHNDIVDLLLERGADPNFAAEKYYPVFPLHELATAGNLSLARKLLDHGALPNRDKGGYIGRQPALWWAFAREHEDMIQLLLERGASFRPMPDQEFRAWGRHLAEMTYHLGYHSMTEILRKHGFEIIEPLPYPRRRIGLSWHRWAEAIAVAPEL